MLYLDPITEFPLGGILRAERNFSLSFLNSSTQEITRQRKFPLRAQSSVTLGLRVHACMQMLLQRMFSDVLKPPEREKYVVNFHALLGIPPFLVCWILNVC
jgi:hypothetical protein